MIWACGKHAIKEAMTFLGADFVREKIIESVSTGITVLNSLVLEPGDHNPKKIAADFKV